MSQNAFLCFDVGRDDTEADAFANGLKEAGIALSIDDRSTKARQQSEDWTKWLRGRIGRCNLMIVLIGKNTCSSAEVAREIKLAKDTNVPFFGVYLEDGDDLECLQLGLRPNRIVPLDWKRISAAVIQLMAEGKNHTFA